MPKLLATKLHDSLCPRCNNRCRMGSICLFEHEPKDETVWDNNPANSYFLDLAKKAEEIMAETKITEEDFINYATSYSFSEDVPSEILSSMTKHGFIS